MRDDVSPTTRPPMGGRPSAAGTRLACSRRGSGPDVVLAHGFTMTGRAWGPFADDLASDHRLTLVDLPGHGGSSQVACGLVEGARLLGEAGGRAAYVGYSMGAR